MTIYQRVCGGSLAICLGLSLSCKSKAPNPESATAAVTPAAVASAAPERILPAPARFKVAMDGLIDERLKVRAELTREGASVSGEYYYEKPGAASLGERTLSLKGTIGDDGVAVLTETAFQGEDGAEVKTGELRGKLESVAVGSGEPALRFTGTWTGGKEKKTLAAVLRELRYDLGEFKLAEQRAEQTNKKQNYHLATSVPRLSGADAARVEAFNKAVDSLVAPRAKEFQKAAAEWAADAANLRGATEEAPPPYELEVSYEIARADRDAVSILMSFYEYTGGAHPNTTTTAFNYDLRANRPVKLADLFQPGAPYLRTLSEYCTRELKKLKNASEVGDGASPKAENFKSWTLTPGGLRISFDRYQVAAYAFGDFEAIVPYSLLKPIANPNGLLAPYLK